MPSATSVSYASRSDENHFWISARRICEHVGAASDTGRRRVLRSVQRRQRLSRERQHRRLVAKLHDVAVGLDDLVGVTGPQRDQTGDGAQRDQVFDRLMRRTVLAVAHGLVRKDEDGGHLHQRGQPDGRPRVVAEDEEGRPESPNLG
jgi:hypothetical protein